jgi:hypothetical protein
MSLKETYKIKTYIPTALYDQSLIRNRYLREYPLPKNCSSYKVEASNNNTLNNNTLLISIFYAIRRVQPILFQAIFDKYVLSTDKNNDPFTIENEIVCMNKSFLDRIKQLIFDKLTIEIKKYKLIDKKLKKYKLQNFGSILAIIKSPWDIEQNILDYRNTDHIETRKLSNAERNKPFGQGTIEKLNKQLEGEKTGNFNLSDEFYAVHMMLELKKKNIPDGTANQILKNKSQFLENMTMDDLSIWIMLAKILPKENIRLKIGVYDEDLKLKNKIYSFINIYYSLNDEVNMKSRDICFIAIKELERCDKKRNIINRYEPLEPCDLRRDTVKIEPRVMVHSIKENDMMCVIDRR